MLPIAHLMVIFQPKVHELCLHLLPRLVIWLIFNHDVCAEAWMHDHVPYVERPGVITF